MGGGHGGRGIRWEGQVHVGGDPVGGTGARTGGGTVGGAGPRGREVRWVGDSTWEGGTVGGVGPRTPNWGPGYLRRVGVVTYDGNCPPGTSIYPERTPVVECSSRTERVSVKYHPPSEYRVRGPGDVLETSPTGRLTSGGPPRRRPCVRSPVPPPPPSLTLGDRDPKEGLWEGDVRSRRREPVNRGHTCDRDGTSYTSPVLPSPGAAYPRGREVVRHPSPVGPSQTTPRHRSTRGSSPDPHTPWGPTKGRLRGRIRRGTNMFTDTRYL